MPKIKVGIISFSDGRKEVHQSLLPEIESNALRISLALIGTGEAAVLNASDIVHSNKSARECAIQIKSMLPDVVIFNVPVFAFPNFAAIAAVILRLPILVISNVNSKLPGLGGLQATCNMMRQNGIACEKIWGNIEDKPVLEKCLCFLRAAYAQSALIGQVYGLIGGRSIGMGSGAPAPDNWLGKFGVDIDHMDQSEILRRAELVPEEKALNAFKWLYDRVTINYDGHKLTEDTLKTQIRHYYAVKDICEEKDFAFVGVKCHYELSAYNCTQCLSAAFSNDPYDFDGPKEPRVFSCEADSEGALTMQVMKLLSGKPVLFCDFRYYDRADNLLYLCNCGGMATWYADRSENPDENMKYVSLHPIIPKYAGAGCHVRYIAKDGPMTFGRITHERESFIFTVFTGQAKCMPVETLETTCAVWPHIFVVPDAPFDTIFEQYDCNHLHGVAGNYIEEIRHFCNLKGVDFRYITK
jgi:L-fucose isomerase